MIYMKSCDTLHCRFKHIRKKMTMFLSKSPKRYHCPYTGCNHLFEKPTVVVHSTGVLRSTYYACPSCKATIEFTLSNKRNWKVVASQNNLPTEPLHILSPLENIIPQSAPQCSSRPQMVLATSKNEAPPDDCLTCSDILSCKNTLPQNM